MRGDCGHELVHAVAVPTLPSFRVAMDGPYMGHRTQLQRKGTTQQFETALKLAYYGPLANNDFSLSLL